jgi:hypothetical protein
MISGCQMQFHPSEHAYCVWPGWLLAGVLLTIVGCSNRAPAMAEMLEVVSKIVGFPLPADAVIVAHRHEHGTPSMPDCSHVWIVRTAAELTGPDHRVEQSRVETPTSDFVLLCEQVAKGQVSFPGADMAVCEDVKWRNGKTTCRLRQIQTQSGWVAALETTSPE